MKLRIDKVICPGTEQEQVLFYAEEDCTLSNYIVYDETFDEDGNLTNKVPHMYRFPNIHVKKGEFVTLKTQGNEGYSKSKMTKPKDAPLHIITRGLDITIFNSDGDKLHLVQIDCEDGLKIQSKTE